MSEEQKYVCNEKALTDVLEERKHQEEKWGEQNHNPYTYLAILQEEVGEYAQACLQTQFGGKHGGLDHMREEAVQVAAVALAIVECLDRHKWSWPISNVDRLQTENKTLREALEYLYEVAKNTHETMHKWTCPANQRIDGECNCDVSPALDTAEKALGAKSEGTK
jgi:NTP pyrophosphatase (non-canonical NTP hydrolase)